MSLGELWEASGGLSSCLNDRGEAKGDEEGEMAFRMGEGAISSISNFEWNVVETPISLDRTESADECIWEPCPRDREADETILPSLLPPSEATVPASLSAPLNTLCEVFLRSDVLVVGRKIGRVASPAPGLASTS